MSGDNGLANTEFKHRTNMKAVYEKKGRGYKILKRGLDILLSGCALLCLSPIFLITAIAIKLEDRGPVFFTQPRAGKDMVPFKMYKFRSMYVDADKRLKELMSQNEQTGHAFKIKNDPRITKVGKFIRRFSIDELPQLLNIFKGDMSIAAPLIIRLKLSVGKERFRIITYILLIWAVISQATSSYKLAYDLGVVSAFLSYFMMGNVIYENFSGETVRKPG